VSARECDGTVGAPRATVRTKWIVLVAAAVAVGATTSWALGGTPYVEVTTADVTTGPLVRMFAMGTLRATRTIDVGTQVSGIVESLDADFNSIVHANQVIAQLESRLYQAALNQTKAAMLQAEANLNQARAELDAAQMAKQDASTKYDRAAASKTNDLITRVDFDAARIAFEQASADVHSAEAGVADAEADVHQADANVTQAQINLDHTVIRSPIDGVVLSRNVDVGQMAGAEVHAPVIFSIATDLTHLQVQLDLDHADIGGLKIGSPVTFDVEEYPDEVFTGTVSQVSPQAMIDVANPDERLRPGMIAVVQLSGVRRDNVTRIPNDALTFRPSARALNSLQQNEASTESVAEEDESSKARTVWTFDGKRFTPISVTAGLADDQWAELLKGNVHPGDQLVTQAVVRRRFRFSRAP
jgi:HlyD family secretion protein